MSKEFAQVKKCLDKLNVMSKKRIVIKEAQDRFDGMYKKIFVQIRKKKTKGNKRFK